MNEKAMKDHRLLIVDDDANICEMLRDVGESAGYSAVSTITAADFQKMYKSVKPTMVMMDLSIGEADGVELLRYLSQNECKCPIVLMSGHDDRVRSSAFRLGGEYGLNMAAQLQKPIDIEMVQNLLEKMKAKGSFINSETLTHAIDNFELVLHYQPLVHIKTRKVLGVEALVRWQPPNAPIIFPDAFISLAEELGIIQPLTAWVMDQAFRQSAIWAKNKNPLTIQINLSAKLLTNIKLPDEIMTMAKKHGVQPSNICFEVTETGVMAQPQTATDILTRLRVKGFSLSLDDFGTGYSSLVELYRMPFREIKIDKSFVMKLMDDAECMSIVHSIIELGHSLKMEVVAEGVETKEALDKLQEMNCDIAQGYYIERPISTVELEKWFKKNTDSELKLISK